MHFHHFGAASEAECAESSTLSSNIGVATHIGLLYIPYSNSGRHMMSMVCLTAFVLVG